MSVPAAADPMGLDLHTLLVHGLGPTPLVAVILRDSPAALANTRRLLRLTPTARVVLFDDGTSDSTAVGVLADCDANGGVTVVRHDAPVGHAACAARAAELAGEADLVVVDCDVEVGPGWVTGLQRVARAGTGVAAVGARLHTGEVAGYSHLTWSETTRAAARAPTAAATAVDELARGAVLFSAAGLRAWRASGAVGLDLPEFCATATGAGLSLLVAGRVLVRGAYGPTADRCAPAADLRSMRSVPPRVAYVVRADDPFAWTDPTHEAARRLGYVQESLRFDLYGADRFRVTRLGPTGEGVLIEEPGPVTAETLAAALIDLGVELLHVADDAEGPLDLILDVAGRIGIPRVLTASVDRGAAAGSPPCEAVIALSAQAVPAHPGARIISPGVAIPGPHPRMRRGRGRKVGPIRVLAHSHEAQDVGVLAVQIAARVGPLIEFHLLGSTKAESGSTAVSHGAHPAHRMWRVLREIDPDLGLVVPNRDNAFDADAAMYRALGVPLVVVGEGAAADEVRLRGGGVVVGSGTPSDAAELLTRLARDRDRLRSLHADLTHEPTLTDLPFVEGLRGCYDALLHRPGHRPRLGYLLLGEFARQDGSAQIRVLTRLAAVAPEFVAARQVFLDEILHRDALREFDTLLVQRRFLGADAEPLLAAVRASGIRMVVDLDDDVLDEGAAARSGGMDVRAHQRVRRELRSRIRSAHTVVVSTPTLAERIGLLSMRPPTVATNHLDPRSWLSEVPTRKSPRRESVRLLYMGTKTHLDDLMLLRAVLDPVAETLGKPVALEVVGVAGKFDGDEWITRLPVPRRAQSYPEFVPWLRVRRARWDAAVAPLTDCHFNQAKSDLKLLEYAMLGLPVVASDVGPYRGGDHLARLTANDPASWVAALTQTLGDLPVAGDRAAAARAYVEAHRMMTQDKALEWLRLVMGDAAGVDCRYGGRHSPGGELEGGRT